MEKTNAEIATLAMLLKSLNIKAGQSLKSWMSTLTPS